MEGQMEANKFLVTESPEAEELKALRIHSRSWTAEQWEEHLSFLEIGLREDLQFNPAKANEPFIWKAEEASEEYQEAAADLLKILTQRQFAVIKLIFWQGKSERQVARIMQLSRSGVYDLKTRALKKLRKYSISLLANFPMVETPTSERSLPVGIGENKLKEEENAER
jgi:RNA polymerase sigma factor (sigma-70 family)